MAKSEDLKVKISLQDKLSSGLGKIGGNLEQLNQRTLAFQEKLRGNFDDMVAGVGTAMGAGASIYAAIMPNVELERSLRALKALGVDGELGAIRDSAQQFTKDFGGTSSEFVNHAATMKRAIGDVNETELAQITSATAKLANATRSDVAQVSKYLGRLYHTYQDEADKIGKVDFISNMANMTAIAAKEFGVSADEMAGSMESISSLAKNYNISLPEQMAIMGVIQQTEYGEGDASSFYEAFIREGSKLGELGISTLDAEGKMRPILDILDQVKTKFGDLNSSDFELLDQTAGDAGMVLQTLLRQSDKLESSLSKMNLSNGTNELDAMAAHHTDVLKQLQGSWTAFSENIGQAVMPVVTVVGSALITGIDWINDFTQAFPQLTTAVIATVLVIAAFTTAISLGSASIAMMRVGMTAMSPVLTLVQSVLSTLTVTTGRYTLANVLSTAKTKLLTGAQWLQTLSTRAQLFAYGQLITLQMTVSNGYTSMTRMLQGLTLASIRQAAVTKTLAAGQAMLNLVMSLNPIGLLVAGLAIGGMMVMRYWEPIKAFFGGFVEDYGQPAYLMLLHHWAPYLAGFGIVSPVFGKR
ncbi:phage tail tape measure protein [Shewanella sp. MTB7]|uniref:phage tail tape measure protein n=1 Tax=Shewanella sp. MTB7 TaxID=2746932 RepID=UPI0022BA2BC3|nr:phage tail tape measure protein [Shewanella sp. MTB7]WBJ93567.1 phage tail tape measure protein [Shewanella sp. MTB7]